MVNRNDKILEKKSQISMEVLTLMLEVVFVFVGKPSMWNSCVKLIVTKQIFIYCFRSPKEKVVVVFPDIPPTCENMADNNNNNRYVWSNEATTEIQKF